MRIRISRFILSGIILSIFIIPQGCREELVNPATDIQTIGIKSFNFSGITGAVITRNDNDFSINAVVPYGTDITSLVAVFDANADTVDTSGILQTSGVTVNDFSQPVVYTLKLDSSTVNYVVYVYPLQIFSIYVTPLQALMHPGKIKQLTATAVMTDSSIMDVTNLATWVSSNSAAVSVGGTGNISTIINGSTSISASLDGISSDSSSGSSAVTVISEICVRNSGSDFAGCGSPENPCQTISWGIAEAQSAPYPIVRVAEGTYSEAAPINMVNGISLHGAYSQDFYTRDFTNNVSNISPVSGVNWAIWATLTDKNTTSISGFTINGTDNPGPDGGGIMVIGTPGSLTIENNIINANQGGIFESHAIEFNNADPSVIRNNLIIGGTAPTSIGIRLHYFAGGDIYNNIIHGGFGGTSSIGIFEGLTYGITFIRNNTIDGGNSPGTSYGIHIQANVGNAATMEIQNNIIFTGNAGPGHCIFESNNTPDFAPSSVQNNFFHQCNTSVYYDDGGLLARITSNDMETHLSSIPQTTGGNLDFTTDTAILAPGLNWLDPSSSLKVKTFGLDGGPGGQNWGFSTDFFGTPRTGNGTDGWSMGAFEQDF